MDSLCFNSNGTRSCVSPSNKIPLQLAGGEYCCCKTNLCNSKHRLTSLPAPPQSQMVRETTQLPLHPTSSYSSSLKSDESCPYFSSILVLSFCSLFVTLAFVALLHHVILKKLHLQHPIIKLFHKIKTSLFSTKGTEETSSTEHIDNRLLSVSSYDSRSGDEITEQSSVDNVKEISNLVVDVDHVFAAGNFGKLLPQDTKLCTQHDAGLRSYLFFSQIFSAINIDTSEHFCVKVATTLTGRAAFVNEVKILQMLSTVEHANIIKYYGIHFVGSKCGFIMEHCQLGSLRSYLDRTVIDSLHLCLDLLRDMASAVAFLHTYNMTEPSKQPVVHRDISSANVLLRSNLRLVLADFGVAAILDESDANNCTQDAKHLKVEGTPYYVAPEILDLSIDLSNVSSSLKHADVYSMGLVMWEIVNRCSTFYDGNSDSVPSHSLPYQNDVNTTSELIEFVADQGRRPSFWFSSNKNKYFEDAPNNSKTQYAQQLALKKEIKKTIEECWDKDEDARLAASCVFRRMSSMSRYSEDSAKLYILSESFL